MNSNHDAEPAPTPKSFTVELATILAGFEARLTSVENALSAKANNRDIHQITARLDNTVNADALRAEMKKAVANHDGLQRR